MSDLRLSVVKDLETELSTVYPVETVTLISAALVRVLSNYEVAERCTDIVPCESVNDRILKQYCACLFVDGKSEKTAYQYRWTCQRLADTIGKSFTEIGVYDIRYFLACEKERGVPERTVENIRSNLSAFFQWMAREDIIPKNPCTNIKPIKYPELVRTPFSEIEIDALRGACRSKKERALIEFLLSTGVRVSELSGMLRTDIDTNKLSVHVRHGKGNKERVTYITPVALKHLLEYWEERPACETSVFSNNRKKPLRPNGVRHVLSLIAERANVSNVHPHRFRRTFASGLAARGMDIQEIKKLLGHSDINTTMEYVYTDDSKVSASYRQYIA